jgi:hypothetical protein
MKTHAAEIGRDQGFAELIAVEQNRCVPMIDLEAQAPRFGAWFSTFAGAILRTLGRLVPSRFTHRSPCSPVPPESGPQKTQPYHVPGTHT